MKVAQLRTYKLGNDNVKNGLNISSTPCVLQGQIFG